MTDNKQWDSAPDFQIDLKKTYFALFDTDNGEFKIELFADKTPTTVNNFIFLEIRLEHSWHYYVHQVILRNSWKKYIQIQPTQQGKMVFQGVK